MEKKEIFYPNNLTEKEIKDLKGWKLKVATLHFGKGRGDCVAINYGYAWIKEDSWSGDYAIHLVAGNGNQVTPISLKDEIEWDNPMDVLNETGFSYEKFLKDYLLKQIKEM